MSNFTISAGLNNGDPLDADPLDQTLSRVRDALNSTIGSYGQPFGENIQANGRGIGAISMQPSSTLEVVRTDPVVTGPENFTSKVYNAASHYPWGGKSNEEQPAGASITFVPKEDCFALIMASVAIDRSFNASISRDAAYLWHNTRTQAFLELQDPNGTIIPGYSFGDSFRTMTSALGGAQVDMIQASGHNVWTVRNVQKGGIYSARVRLTMISVVDPAFTNDVGVSQQLGSGSSMSVFLFYR